MAGDDPDFIDISSNFIWRNFRFLAFRQLFLLR